jgi:hypothetical protein
MPPKTAAQIANGCSRQGDSYRRFAHRGICSSSVSANALLTSNLAAIQIKTALDRIPVALDKHVFNRCVEAHKWSNWLGRAQRPELKQVRILLRALLSNSFGLASLLGHFLSPPYRE